MKDLNRQLQIIIFILGLMVGMDIMDHFIATPVQARMDGAVTIVGFDYSLQSNPLPVKCVKGCM